MFVNLFVRSLQVSHLLTLTLSCAKFGVNLSWLGGIGEDSNKKPSLAVARIADRMPHSKLANVAK